MIKRFRFGNPIETDTVINKCDISLETIDKFTVTNEEKLIFTYQMDPQDVVYGLGENINGINKRNFTYISRCMDGSRHTEDRNSLYAAHNFMLIKGKETFGVFFDVAGIISFDVGETDIDKLIVTSDDQDLDVYIIDGTSMQDIVTQFRAMIGRSYIPPKWAFGYHQSRWFYKTEDDFREIAKKYQEAKIPLDAIYMDIDYMDEYSSFTINRKNLPNFEGLVSEMKEQGIHLVPIIDAGIKVKPGYNIYEEGVKGNHFCKDANGNDFKCGVWPGYCHLVDVLNDEHRKWFGDQYKFLLDKGIDGIWNDMNEPSIFYTDERLNEAYEMVDRLRGSELDLQTYFGMRKKFSTLSSNPKDYQLFYHDINGKKVRHDKVHNLYGYNLSRAAGEAFERMSPDKRILFFSRSSMIGMHRYSGIWTGDNHAWWSHLKLSIHQMPNINMCGFLYTGSDIGGFGSDTNEELMTRWVEFGIFTPLMRNHSQSRRAQELYVFNHTETFKNLVELRYALIPYLYSEFVKAALNNDSYFKPLSFVYEDDARTYNIEDQLMVGESIMIAPVYEQNCRGRYVYLPEDMKMIKYRSLDDYEEVEMSKGDHYINVALNELIFFIRKNHVVPMAKPALTTKDMDFDNLYLLSYVKDPIEYVLYDDDGYTTDMEREEHFHKIAVNNNECHCTSKKVTLL